jgi:hypothetical protein
LRNHSAPAGKNGYWPAAGALDNAGIAARGGKTIDFLHPVTPRIRRAKCHEIINILYLFVNNQFIPDGIGIAKLGVGFSTSRLGRS